MDLVLKVGIVIVVLIGIFSIGFLLYSANPQKSTLTANQAKQLILNDLSLTNPNATVNIVNVSQSKLVNSSWNIVVTITYNATRPCPTLIIEGFDYPATGFVPSTDNIYTTKCRIYGLSAAPYYVISSPMIAIARSYNASLPVIINYVTLYGYNSTNVYAKFYPTLDASATPLHTSYSNVWDINYSATGSGVNEYVLLGQSGNVIGNYTLQK